MTFSTCCLPTGFFNFWKDKPLKPYVFQSPSSAWREPNSAAGAAPSAPLWGPSGTRFIPMDKHQGCSYLLPGGRISLIWELCPGRTETTAFQLLVEIGLGYSRKAKAKVTYGADEEGAGRIE